MPVAPDPIDKTKPTLTIGKQPVDWERQLSLFGLDKQIVNRLGQIWQSANYDAQTATPLALAYIRGTPWYQRTFPGITAGIQKGLFTDERGYQAYRNSLSQVYKQYLHRPVTAAEVGQFAAQGKAPSQVGAQLESQATLGTLSDPLKALFTPVELKALTDQEAGLHSALGARIEQQATAAAALNPIYRQYTNAPVTRAQVAHAVANDINPETVAKQFAGTAYVAANYRQIEQTTGAFGGGEFTSPQLVALGREQAGIDTPQGAALMAKYKQAQDRFEQSFRNVLGRVAPVLPGGQQRRGDVAA